MKEIRLALMEAGRRLGAFVRHRRRVADEEKKRSHIEKYIPHIGDALQTILGLSMAGWNVIASVILAAIAFVGAKKAG